MEGQHHLEGPARRFAICLSASDSSGSRETWIGHETRLVRDLALRMLHVKALNVQGRAVRLEDALVPAYQT